MELAFGVVIGLIILVLLVVVHELGHAIVARRNGVVVEEFGIGFPPRLLGKKLRNGILLSINWLPLGGFVKLQGEHDAAENKGDYGAATFWQKTKILFAGVVMNLVVAVILLTGLAFVGVPKIIPNQFSLPADTQIIASPVQVAQLVPDYPAEAAGLKVGDTIISLGGQSVTSAAQLIELAKERRGQTVTVVYERDGAQTTKEVTLRDQETGVFGVSPRQHELIKATWSAPIVGVVTTGQFAWVTLEGLGQLVGNLFSGLFLQLSSDQATRQQGGDRLQTVTESVAGPVGILGTIFPQAEQAGPRQLIFLTAIISLSLAVMNALPIPALDGGRWFVTTIYRVLRRPLTKEREEKIQGTGFLVLMGLIVLVTIGDVARLF